MDNSFLIRQINFSYRFYYFEIFPVHCLNFHRLFDALELHFSEQVFESDLLENERGNPHSTVLLSKKWLERAGVQQVDTRDKTGRINKASASQGIGSRQIAEFLSKV